MHDVVQSSFIAALWPQDTAEEVILARTRGTHAAGTSSSGADAADAAVTDRRVLRNALLVSLRRVAIGGDGGNPSPVG